MNQNLHRSEPVTYTTNSLMASKWFAGTRSNRICCHRTYPTMQSSRDVIISGGFSSMANIAQPCHWNGRNCV